MKRNKREKREFGCHSEISKKIIARMRENDRRAVQIARQENGYIDDNVDNYDVYRYLGMTFPDSPFGNIIK